MAPLADPGNHGDANLKCSPATPWSAFLFFVSNYLAHCATVKLYPGSSQADTAVATALALFLPTSGTTRALFAIVRYSRFRRGRNPLERAALAGALRTVVRNEDWRAEAIDLIIPKLDSARNIRTGPGKFLLNSSGHSTVENVETSDGPGNDTALMVPDSHSPMEPITVTTDALVGSHATTLQNAPIANGISVLRNVLDANDFDKTFTSTASFNSHASKYHQSFHGKAALPQGYSWTEVNPEAKVTWARPSRGREEDMVRSDPSISSNYNWVQTIIAIFQLGNGAVTLYRSRGDQIERYGYAAFGLTVIPYLVMTIVNLLAQIASADYPNVYMVGSPEMEEARGRGGVFDGVVGYLEPDHLDRENGAERPVYRFNAVDGEGQSGRILFMERVSGSSVYPAVVRLTGEKRSEDDGITVAAYTPYQLHTHPRTRFRVWAFQFFVLPMVFGCLSLIVVGALTRFDEGQSTRAQRGWIMSWLVVGIGLGWFADMIGSSLVPDNNMLDGYDAKAGKVRWGSYLGWVIPALILFVGPLCVPAIGGFVVVGGMLREYGICETA